MNILREIDCELINGLLKHINFTQTENNAINCEIYLYPDFVKFRERNFGIYYYFYHKNQTFGGSIDIPVTKLLQESTFFNICEQDCEKYASILIDIIKYKYKHPDINLN